MVASATQLFEQLQNLPATEKEAFSELFHRWEGDVLVERQEGSSSEDLPALPDFMARMQVLFPHGVPGRPASEIVDEGRGPRP